jgi:hypothetical protein
VIALTSEPLSAAIACTAEAGMDPKTRNLILLAALSPFCACVAFTLDQLVLCCMFLAPSVAALVWIFWEDWF